MNGKWGTPHGVEIPKVENGLFVHADLGPVSLLLLSMRITRVGDPPTTILTLERLRDPAKCHFICKSSLPTILQRREGTTSFWQENTVVTLQFLFNYL